VTTAAVPRCRVLVADEDTELLGRYQQALADDQRFEVVGAAADGGDALWMAAACRPDVVLVSEDLPVLGGAELVGYLRRALPAALIAVTSQVPTEAGARAASGAGAVGYLAKPGPGERLGDVVLSACERRTGERRVGDRRRADRRQGLRDRRAKSRGSDRRQRARRQAERRLDDRRARSLILADPVTDRADG